MLVNLTKPTFLFCLYNQLIVPDTRSAGLNTLRLLSLLGFITVWSEPAILRSFTDFADWNSPHRNLSFLVETLSYVEFKTKIPNSLCHVVQLS